MSKSNQSIGPEMLATQIHALIYQHCLPTSNLTTSYNRCRASAGKAYLRHSHSHSHHHDASHYNPFLLHYLHRDLCYSLSANRTPMMDMGRIVYIYADTFLLYSFLFHGTQPHLLISAPHSLVSTQLRVLPSTSPSLKRHLTIS